MNIVQSPDPLLRQICVLCDIEDKSLKRLAKQMAKAMYKNSGCGLAAPQVGVLKRLVVIDCDSDEEEQNPIFMVNPEVIVLEGDPVVEDEGCLSCPGISVPVKRQPFARVRFLDLDGEEWTIEGDGLLGRCVQHEIDHLNGRTLFESCDPIARLEALRAYDVACRAGARPGEISIEPSVR